MYRQPVGVVHPALAAGAAIGAGAFLLWLKAQAERRALEQFKHSRAFTYNGLYRKPNYSGMSGAELRRATQLLDSWREDFYQDPLTGTMIERREVQKELLRRSGQGGFLFIPPVPVAAPAVNAGASVAWAALSSAAAALLLRVFLPQIWGWFASRPAKQQEAPYPGNLAFTGKVPASGNTTPATFVWYASAGQVRPAIAGTCAPGSATNQSSELKAGTVSNVVEAQVYVEMGSCGPYRYGFRVRNNLNQWSLSVLTSSVTQGNAVDTRSFRAAWAGTNSADLTYPVVDLPLPDGYVAPSPEVEPRPEIPYLPVPAPTPVRPLPQTVPTPETEPQPQPTPIEPGPAKPPIAPSIAPQTPAPVVPRQIPGETPIKDGAIVPQAPAPVAVTPPDAHFPVPGAPPVTGNGPRPTPEGIAQELGRLEQKLAKMLNPGPDGPGDGTDRQQLLEQRMRQIWEFLTSITASGGYGLSSPCELDDNGERIVTTVEYGGGFNSLDVLSNKIDALAALLQVHKDLKQPICKQTPAVGQPVTVNFVQVD